MLQPEPDHYANMYGFHAGRDDVPTVTPDGIYPVAIQVVLAVAVAVAVAAEAEAEAEAMKAVIISTTVSLHAGCILAIGDGPAHSDL